MLYKPGFCCQCGEQIERVRWRLWTSRRFCPLCETEFVLEEWALRIIPCIGVICGILYFGSFFQSSADAPQTVRALSSPDNVIRPAKAETPVPEATEPENDRLLTTETNVQRTAPSQNLTKIAAPDHPPAGQEQNSEPVYFCGAETKKGTPCSRRMKGGGRCWQHVGHKAMLPDEKLLISQ